MGLSAEEYKQLSRQEFGKAAAVYESGHAGVYEICKKDYPDILKELEKEPFESLLDCGCGTAPMLSLLYEKYPEKHYTGIDLTPEMIEMAKMKELPGITLVVGDCENLPFSPESFDTVICSQSFHHYPNPEAFFQSVYRVLQPNGRFILRDMCVPKILKGFVNKVEMPLINLLLKKEDVRVYEEEDIERLCRKSGLKLERFERRKGMRLHCLMRKLD